MLRLRYGQSVARHDHDLIRSREDRGCLFGRRAFHRTWLPERRRAGRVLLPKRAKQHVRKRAIHRLGHVHGKNQPRGAVQRSRDDQQLAVEHEPHGGRRKAGIGVE